MPARSHASCDEIENIADNHGLEKITINDVIQQALETHPSVMRSRLSYEKSQADIEIAQSARDVQGNLNLAYGTLENFAGSPRGNITSFTPRLSTSVSVFDFGLVRSQIKAAEERSRAAQAKIENLMNRIALAAADSYISVLRERIALVYSLNAYNDLWDLKKNLEKNERTLESYDIELIKSRKQSVCNTVRIFQGNINRANNYYKSILDYYPVDFFLVKPEAIFLSMEEGEILENSLKFHPLIKESNFNIKGAESNLLAVKKERLPRVFLDASINVKDARSQVFGDKSLMSGYVGGRISIPLFDGGKRRNKVKKANHDLSIENYKKNENYRQIRRQVEDLIFAIKNSKDRIKELELAVESNTKTYDDMLAELYASEKGSDLTQKIINTIDQRMRLYESKVDLNAQKHILILDSYNLLAQQGLLLNSL